MLETMCEYLVLPFAIAWNPLTHEVGHRPLSSLVEVQDASPRTMRSGALCMLDIRYIHHRLSLSRVASIHVCVA